MHHCIATGFTKATTSSHYIVLELYSRAGESIRINISSNDSTYTAYAIRTTNTYGKIKAVYFNPTDGKLYATTDNYANNLGCKVMACSEDLETPVMTTVDTIPSGAASITITSDLTGSGTSGYLAKFSSTNTLTNGPQLGTDTTKFLNNKGEWAVPPGTTAAQIQSDWSQTDSSKADFIKNKPSIPTKVSELTNDSGYLTSAPNPTDYYWANVKVSSTSSTATVPTVQKIGITGSTITNLNAAVTLEYDSGLKALKFVFA